MNEMGREARERLVFARVAELRDGNPELSRDEAARIAWWDWDQAFQWQREQDLREVQTTLVAPQ